MTRLIVEDLSELERDRLTKQLAPKLTKYIPFSPTPKQAAFLLLNNCREAFYGGAAGGGKSVALLMASLQYVDVPGYNAILFRRTYSELELPEALMDMASEWLYPFRKSKEVHWSELKKRYTFLNGATLSFGYLDKAGDRLRYQCFHPDTEILTKQGWKKVEEVKLGEKVATVNPKNSRMTYKPTTKTFAYDFEGDLLEIYQKRGIAYCVTSNHTIFASTRRVPEIRKFKASELPFTAKIPKTVKWRGKKPEMENVSFSSPGHNGKTVSFPIKTWFSFLGWYIAEGNVCPNRYIISLSQTNFYGRRIIRRMLDNAHIRYSNEVECFRFTNKKLGQYLKSLGRSGDKFIPKKWLQYDVEYLELLLEALVEGDGTWRTDTIHKCGHFVTSSIKLKDDFMELALKCGYRVTQSLRQGNPPDSPYGTKPRWHVSICKNNKPQHLEQKAHNFPYKGKVYCIEVKPHHSVIIRYRDKVCWIGQSSAFHFAGFDELTHFEERDYIYLWSRVRRTKKQKALNVPLRVRAASNPGGPGHSFVKQRFLVEGPSKGRIFIPAVMSDNPYLDTESYDENLKELDPITRAQLKDGDWEISGGGKIFKADWFEILDKLPEIEGKFIPRVRYWDLAATDADVSKTYGYKPAYTVGLKMARFMTNNTPLFVIEDVRRFQKTPDGVEAEIKKTASEDGRNVDIWMEEEPGSSGKNTINYYQKSLKGFSFRGFRESGSKVLRANRVAATAGAGKIKLLRGMWNQDFLDEVEFFPEGRIKDQVDGLSGAFDKLSNFASYSVIPTAVGNEQSSYWAMK